MTSFQADLQNSGNTVFVDTENTQSTNTKTDSFGDRVKALEKTYAAQKFDENVPFCVRIDGKAFHTYTKGLQRPFDERLSKAFIDSMNFLLENTDARLGYTQSDEISLVFFQTASYQTNFFGSRIQKLSSVLASMTTARFNWFTQQHIPEKSDTFALFDAMVWSVPTLKDAADVVVWRQEDAIKNAVSMAASAYYSQSELHKKSSLEKIQLLEDKNILWNDYPEFFKSGTFARKQYVEQTVDPELKAFSANAQSDTFLRSEIINYNLPRLRKMDNYEDVLFSPIFAENDKAIADRNARKKRPKIA